jgi:hypothetical protein
MIFSASECLLSNRDITGIALKKIANNNLKTDKFKLSVKDASIALKPIFRFLLKDDKISA